MLAAVSATLPVCREPRLLRQRFEEELRGLMNAREVELRDGSAMPRPPESSISVDVTSGDLTLGAIDASFDEGSCAFDEWDEQMLESARHLAALVLVIDRAQRAGALSSADVPGRCPMAPRRSSAPVRPSARCARGSSEWPPPRSPC